MVGVIWSFAFLIFLLFETFAYIYGKESFCDLSNQLPQQENLAARCKSDLKLKKRQISSGDDATVSHPIERITEWTKQIRQLKELWPAYYLLSIHN